MSIHHHHPVRQKPHYFLDNCNNTNYNDISNLIKYSSLKSHDSINESIKITIRFLTNEVRSDGIKVIVHKKKCNIQQKCTVKKISSTLEQELQVAILKKAVLFEKEFSKNKKKFKRREQN